MSAQSALASGLVIIDMQNAFCHPDGAVFVPQAHSQLPLTADLIGSARAAGIPVAYTATAWKRPADIPAAFRHRHPGLVSNWDARGGLGETCWGARIAHAIAPRSDEYVLRKRGFCCPGLAGLVTKLGLSSVFLAGTAASSCVYAAALTLFDADVEVLAIKDCISGLSDEHSQPWLDSIERHLGSVITFDDYCERACQANPRGLRGSRHCRAVRPAR